MIDQIEALEVLGAAIIAKNEPREKAISYWKRAIKMRYI